MLKLNEVSEIIMGQSPSSATYNTAGEGLPFFQGNADFGDEHPNVRMFCSNPIKIAEVNDVLLSVRAPIGAVNVADKKCCIGRGLAAIRPQKEKSITRYLFHLLIANRGSLENKGTGSTFKAITGKVLNSVKVPHENVNEQKAIADILDKIVATIRKRRVQVSLCDDLVKSQFIEMFGEVSDECLLEQVSEFVTVGIANSATHAYSDNGIIMLRNQNIKENYLDENDLIYITPEFAQKYKTKQLKANDILVIRTGYPGVACLVPSKYEGCQTFTTLIVRLKKNVKVSPQYVCHYINSKFGKRYVESEKVGVAQQNFGAKALAKMPIKVPSLTLQNQFTAFVEQTDKSKFRIKQSLEKLEILYKALLQKYFG